MRPLWKILLVITRKAFRNAVIYHDIIKTCCFLYLSPIADRAADTRTHGALCSTGVPAERLHNRLSISIFDGPTTIGHDCLCTRYVLLFRPRVHRRMNVYAICRTEISSSTVYVVYLGVEFHEHFGGEN